MPQTRTPSLLPSFRQSGIVNGLVASVNGRKTLGDPAIYTDQTTSCDASSPRV